MELARMKLATQPKNTRKFDRALGQPRKVSKILPSGQFYAQACPSALLPLEPSGCLIRNQVSRCDSFWRLLFSTQTCQNSHATHMRMQQDSPHGFQRARPFCNNNRQACHLPRAYCAKRVLGYSSLSSSLSEQFYCFVGEPLSAFCVTTPGRL